MRNENGLTLIELLAVVAIVAILAGIAVVSYRSYLVRARLQDAKVALETVRAEQEQWRAENGQYAPPTSLQFFGASSIRIYEDYKITFNYQQPTSFEVQATPEPVDGRQSYANNNKYGGWIRLKHDGSKTHESGINRWP